MYSSNDKKKELNSSSTPSSWLACCSNKFQCFPAKSCLGKSLSPPPPPPLSSESKLSENGIHDDSKAALVHQRKPGGWKAMPFVLGNETFERLASIGLLANFMVFLLTQFHMDQVYASNVLNVWSGFTNFAPLIGAYISDSHLGRFRTIAYASFASCMGMVTLTLIAWLPQLHPPTCNVQSHQCIGPTNQQFGVLALALGLLSIGSSGIRPCSIPFGVDQFDATTDEGRKGINSFFNWYYTSFTVVLIIALTLVVYIQDSVSWTWGFGIPTVLMFCSIVLFFVGTRFYVYVKPEGSVFSGIAQVVVAAIKKRKAKLPNNDDQQDVDGVYYDPPQLEGALVRKLPLTNKFRFLNKAALITNNELQPNHVVTNPWSLSSIQRVEETKCLFKIIPIWASGIICFTAMAQQGTFIVSQASKMNRHIGPNFQVPAGSLSVISMITVGIWLPIYDRILVPRLRKITKIENGITLLQRMGIGIVFSVLSMIVAGVIERWRRETSLSSNKPVTVFWLAPQLILMGFSEAFNIIAQIEFYNKEFPENMSSVANSLFSCTMAGASYISALVVNVVHNTTGGKNGRPDWLTKDINQGRVENFYYLIAGMGVLNFGYFVWVTKGYRYKSRVRVDEEEKLGFNDVELSVAKH